MTAVGILPVARLVAAILEDDEHVHAVSGRPPDDWAPERLYVYPTALRETPFESGPGRRQDFTIAAVFVAPSGEAARQLVDEDVDEYLDELRGRYLDAVRHNAVTVLWHHMTAAEARAPRTLEGRGVAFDLTGYRLVD